MKESKLDVFKPIQIDSANAPPEQIDMEERALPKLSPDAPESIERTENSEPEKELDQKEEVKEEKTFEEQTTSPNIDEASAERKEEPKQYSKLEQDIYKERERRRRVQEENRTLKDRLGKIEASMQDINSQSQDQQKIKKIQEKLGIDADAAAKLVEAIKEVVPDQKRKSSFEDKEETFRRRALRASEVKEDWADLQDDMIKRFQADYEIDAEEALSNGPLYYYNEAKHSRSAEPEVFRQEGRKEMARKVTEKNLAATESSRNAVGRSQATNEWTPERLKEVTGNPELYKKYRNEILEAVASGKIK